MTTEVCLVLYENNTVVINQTDSQPLFYVVSTDDIDKEGQPLPAHVTGTIPELAKRGYTNIQNAAQTRVYYKDIFGS